jgi:monothiol glutaredoxin
VLANPEIRKTLPQFANWPTFPQLYVQGELIGGCDIVLELYQTGELQTILAETL